VVSLSQQHRFTAGTVVFAHHFSSTAGNFFFASNQLFPNQPSSACLRGSFGNTQGVHNVLVLTRSRRLRAAA
jgi:hypothetical protein